MAGFVGRERELTLLKSAVRGRKSAFIPIYGRRRVGKSELILRFLKGQAAVYYVGKQAPPGLQISEFLQEAARTLNEPLLARVASNNWSTALDAVEQAWPKGRRKILAFDEFQWMAESSPELPSVLQARWDRRWKKGGVTLILCGSSIGFMEREVLGKQSPLFERRTAEIFLRPFSYIEAAEFHPSFSTVDLARVHFLFGGVAQYLSLVDDSFSVETNVRRLVLDENGPLHREPEFLLREELREVENYHGVLMAISGGESTLRGIATATGLRERGLHYYVQQLSELGYIRKRYPLEALGRSVRRVRYELDDALLRFWFRFVFPNQTYLAHRGPRETWKNRIRPHVAAFFGSCFQHMCRDAMPLLLKHEGVSARFEVGEYWDKKTQIDVVAARDDGWIDVGECKWRHVRSLNAVVAEIHQKAARHPNPMNATLGKRIFVRKKPRGAERVDADVRWHDLEDLYAS